MTSATIRADEPFEVSAAEGWWCGPWRRPRNNSSHEVGSIHDDATARGLGFRGGTIAGSIHMEQFLPLLRHVWGDPWQQTGGLSLWFREPSLDGEPVQAQIAVEGGHRRGVRMVNAAGAVVLEGSASLSLDGQGAVRQRMQQMQPGAAPRILAQVQCGWTMRGVRTRIPRADVLKRLDIITECRAELAHADIQGVGLAPLSAAVHAARAFEDHLPIPDKRFVGLFGAIEWQWIHGPMFTETDYELDAKVLAVTDSPRSEMLWTEVMVTSVLSGRDVARMLILSRLLKSSSPLWQSEVFQR
ncbi:MAG: hypothetical protein RL500_866 [Pseudomonadota bacterium]